MRVIVFFTPPELHGEKIYYWEFMVLNILSWVNMTGFHYFMQFSISLNKILGVVKPLWLMHFLLICFFVVTKICIDLSALGEYSSLSLPWCNCFNEYGVPFFLISIYHVIIIIIYLKFFFLNVAGLNVILSVNFFCWNLKENYSFAVL